MYIPYFYQVVFLIACGEACVSNLDAILGHACRIVNTIYQNAMQYSAYVLFLFIPPFSSWNVLLIVTTAHIASLL